MGPLDVIIALFLVAAVLRGARTGFLAGAFSLAGVVLGAAVGSRVAPLILPEGQSPVFGAALTLASIVAFALLGDVLARAIGGSLRSRLRSTASDTLDGLGGAVLGLALSLLLVWVVGIFVLQSPPLSRMHPAVERSKILGTLNDRMPSELLTEAVSRLDPLPEVRGPEADVADPDAGITSDPEVAAARFRTVRIRGIACGYGVEGSGWVAAPNLIVTNAHVVAGESMTRVQPGGKGESRRARVIVFDPKNDIAVLRVRRLGIPPLTLAGPRSGESVAVLGFPEDGPFDARPARTGETRRVISTDAYGRGPVDRTVTSFRVHVRPGNSGGPAVNDEGEVVATIFASRKGSNSSGFGIPSQIVQRHLEAAARRLEPVNTGGCAN
jgi:S1-C subfamily serine protease